MKISKCIALSCKKIWQSIALSCVTAANDHYHQHMFDLSIQWDLGACIISFVRYFPFLFWLVTLLVLQPYSYNIEHLQTMLRVLVIILTFLSRSCATLLFLFFSCRLGYTYIHELENKQICSHNHAKFH